LKIGIQKTVGSRQNENPKPQHESTKNFISRRVAEIAERIGTQTKHFDRVYPPEADKQDFQDILSVSSLRSVGPTLRCVSPPGWKRPRRDETEKGPYAAKGCDRRHAFTLDRLALDGGFMLVYNALSNLEGGLS
jgi:hypothetical protein